MERQTPRAEVELVVGETRVSLGDVRPSVRCDLSLVDALARLQLHAGRMGWRIELVDASPDVHELLDLVGLTDVLAPLRA